MRSYGTTCGEDGQDGQDVNTPSDGFEQNLGRVIHRHDYGYFTLYPQRRTFPRSMFSPVLIVVQGDDHGAYNVLGATPKLLVSCWHS